jgi:hypothetical protein
LALLLLFALVGVVSTADPDVADPLPLRRIQIPAEQLKATLASVADGTLRRMDRREFEQLVQQANKASRARSTAPQLVEAVWSASLEESAAESRVSLATLRGTAQMKVLLEGSSSSLLSFPEGFNLAARQPRFENREAILTRFPLTAEPTEKIKPLTGAIPGGKPTESSVVGVWIDKPGQQTLMFDWSAAGEIRPEGTRFDLRLPSATVGVFDLELPANRGLTSLDGATISGPTPSSRPGWRNWRIACGAKNQLSLLVSGPGEWKGKRDSDAVFCLQKSIQRLSPDGVDATFSFTLQAASSEFHEVSFAIDPSLRPIELRTAELESWKTEPGKLLVRLRRPVRSALLEIRCFAGLLSRAEDKGKANEWAWSSPWMRLQSCQGEIAADKNLRLISRGETLEIWFSPQLRISSWNAGDFRLIESALVQSGTTAEEAKVRQRRLTLEGGGVSQLPSKTDEIQARRPSATMQTPGVEFLARETLSWRILSDVTELTARLDYDVRQGQLFQLPVRLSAGWDIESVEMTPAESLRNWVLLRGKQPLLLVDLRRPLQAGGVSKATLTLKLRGNQALNQRGAMSLNFPDVGPVGALFREGLLDIDLDEELWQATVRTPLTALNDAPLERPRAEYSFPFRGEGPTGSLQLEARQLRLIARTRTDLSFVAPNERFALRKDRLFAKTRMLIESTGGIGDWVDVVCTETPEATAFALDPRAAVRLRKVERRWEKDVAQAMLPLASTHAVSAAMWHLVTPQLSHWRVHFDRPLPSRRPMSLTLTHNLQQRDGVWPIPLTWPLQANLFDGELIAPSGLVTVQGASPNLRPLQGNRFRFVQGPTPAWLDVTPRKTIIDPEATLEKAILTTTILPGGERRYHFRCRVVAWPHPTFPIELPQNTTLLAVGINGQWIEQLSSRRDEQGRILLGLPNENALLELLYSAQGEQITANVLQGPEPQLPIRLSGVDHRWLLPPRVRPLSEAAVYAWPDGVESQPPPSPTHRLLRWLRAGQLSAKSDAEQSRTTLADAFAGLRVYRGREQVRLDTLVEEMASGYLREKHPLIIDQWALQEASWKQSSRVTIRPRDEGGPAASARAMPWVEDDLVVVAVDSAVLLTTRSALLRGDDVLPVGVASAVQQAAKQGRDNSGRYLSAAEWLAAKNPTTSLASLPLSVHDLEGWTLWDAIVTSHDNRSYDHLSVLSRPIVTWLGLILAGLLLIAYRHTWRKAGTRRVLLWPLCAGLSLAWLPQSLSDLAWWPLLMGVGFVLVRWIGLNLAGSIEPSRVSRGRSTMTQPASAKSSNGNQQPQRIGQASAGLLLMILLVSSISAQRPEVAAAQTVWLLNEEGAKPSVLVRPELLTKLQALAKATTTAPSAVLVRADYEGAMISAERAEFKGTFLFHSFQDESQRIELALGDVELVGDVLLGGARVLPSALNAPKKGYSLKLRGAGTHKVELRFQLNVGTPEARASLSPQQLRLSLPSVPQSRLVFSLPDNVGWLDALPRSGMQKITKEPAKQRLELEPGASPGPIVLQWFPAERISTKARAEYREAWLWELRPEASLLLGQVRYSLSEGLTSQLELEVPDTLEVRSVVARRVAAKGTELIEAPVRLRQWGVGFDADNKTRLLRLEFATPISGEVDVSLDLVPRKTWGANSILPWPKPRGRPVPKTSGYLAFRASGLEVNRSRSQQLTATHAAMFAPFWTTRPAGEINYAATFLRDSGQAPELEVQLRPQVVRVDGTQDIRLEVGPARADLTATIQLTAKNKDLSLIEWDIAAARPVIISSVTGPEVSRWSQSGTKLLVWLEKTTANVRLELSGWLPLSVAAKEAKAQSRLELPCLRSLLPGEIKTQFFLEPQAGSLIQSVDLRQLVEQNDLTTRRKLLVAKGPFYGGSLLVRPMPGPLAEMELVAKSRTRESTKELTWEAKIAVERLGETRTLAIRVQDWPYDAWLEADGIKIVQAQSRRSQQGSSVVAERLLLVEVDSKKTQEINPLANAGKLELRLAGKIAMDDLDPLGSLPKISLVGIPMKKRVRIEGDLIVASASGVEAIGGNEWQVTKEDWSMRFLPPSTTQKADIEVLGSELRASLHLREIWEIEARYQVRHDRPAELSFQIPAERVESIKLRGVSVDEQPISLSDVVVDGDRIRVPLNKPQGIRRVRLRYTQASPTRDRIDFSLLRLEASKTGPTLFTVDVPPTWQLMSSNLGASETGSTRRVRLENFRANLELESLRGLTQASSGEGECVACRRRFERSWRVANLAVVTLSDAERPGWLSTLERQREQYRKIVGKELGDSTSSEEPPAFGIPHTWTEQPADAVLRVRLAPQSRQQNYESLVFSFQWMGLLLVLWFLTLWNFLRRLGRMFWPEIFLGMGLLGWLWLGLTAAIGATLLVGVLGRGLFVGRRLSWWFTQKTERVTSILR